MNTPQLKKRSNLIQRTAFTLVEMMVVILIISILAGIATPVIFRAIRITREFTIQNEIVQMDAAVEQFNVKYGFYPPAIGPGLEIDTNNSAEALVNFRRYLNRIAPNHDEGGVTGGSRLNTWWNNVGVNLDADSSLVFWLSGLCLSKQYPLSGSVRAAGSLAPYDANRFVDDSNALDINGNALMVDRDVFYQFQVDQLVSVGGFAGIKAYHQANGSGDSLAFVYRDSKSYISANSSVSHAYHLGLDGSGNPVNFFNPTTFQIVGPGMDGQIADLTATPPLTNIQGLTDFTQDDNITNFAEGRLDSLDEFE